MFTDVFFHPTNHSRPKNTNKPKKKTRHYSCIQHVSGKHRASRIFILVQKDSHAKKESFCTTKLED
jgi:hypothetical protein